VLQWEASEEEEESGDYNQRHISTTVFEGGGKDISSLCFRGVFHTIRRALVIFGTTRLQQRRKKPRSG